MDHEKFMHRCLELAAKGWPDVQPNPMVGCVIVKAGKIVAEGWHEKFGGPHAEVNAIKNLPKEVAPADCTLYVSLEPCRHHGKTGPCADHIIEKGFKKVVVACTDPNPLMAGSGVRKLLEAGIDVTTNILEKEARQQNKRFMTFFEKKRPYVTLKWALSHDGFISRYPVPSDRRQNLISGPEAQRLVHALRAETMAVLVGKNTVLADDPLLTTRLVKGRNPMRVFIDRNLEVPRTAAIYNGDAPTMVFNANVDDHDGRPALIRIDFKGNVPDQVLHKLYQWNIQSVLVEGGTRLLNDFISQKLYDEAFVFQNPNLELGSGVKGPEFALPNTFELIGDDKLYHTVMEEVPLRKAV
jgi:diaminohydroxyphosphoribosylaminopyrimidine deaminase / 5-amino-6-(5-phosphoribosylamino)uracil reductase